MELVVIDLGLTFLQSFLAKTGHALPAEVVTSIEAAVVALQAHKDDLVTKAALEAQRG